MYEAVFFDLDGTLVDTERMALRSNREAFATLGHDVDEQFLHAMIGKDAPTITAMLRETMPDLDLERLEHALYDAFYRGVEDGLELKPGVTELLTQLDLPAAIVTSSRRPGATRKLHIAGITDAFAEIITVEDVTNPKPAPDPYLLAAERLGVAPARCLVFEDSEIGAQSGHRAGCTVVQVEDVIPPTGRWAHHVAKDLLTGARLAGLLR